MSVDGTREKAAQVDGFLGQFEGPLLYELASKMKSGCIVEIGSWKGKSTVWIASSLKDQKRKIPFYAIDPHTGSEEHQVKRKKVWTFDEFKKNLKQAKVTSFVKPLVMTSVDAVSMVKEPISFIFIDGDHTYEAVKRDFELWFPKVKVGGIMAFHDTTNWPGPKKVTKDHVYFSSNFKDVKFTQSISYGIKVRHITLGERLNNWMMYGVKEFYGKYSTLPVPEKLKEAGRKFLDLFKN